MNGVTKFNTANLEVKADLGEDDAAYTSEDEADEIPPYDISVSETKQTKRFFTPSTYADPMENAFHTSLSSPFSLYPSLDGFGSMSTFAGGMTTHMGRTLGPDYGMNSALLGGFPTNDPMMMLQTSNPIYIDYSTGLQYEEITVWFHEPEHVAICTRYCQANTRYQRNQGQVGNQKGS